MIETINTTSSTLAASQVIPLGNTSIKTNNRISIVDNGLDVQQIGYYTISGQFVLTGTATGSVSVQMYANGTAIDGAYATGTFAAVGDTITLDISKVVKIVPSTPTNKAKITFVVSSGCTLVNAITKVQRVI